MADRRRLSTFDESRDNKNKGEASTIILWIWSGDGVVILANQERMVEQEIVSDDLSRTTGKI